MTGRRRSTSIRSWRCSRGRTARQAGADFLEALVGHLLLSGNAYVEAVAAGRSGFGDVGDRRASCTRCGPTA